MSNQPLFQLRKELSTSLSADESDVTQSFVDEFQSHNNADSSAVDKFTNEVVVTENEKYTVSKLPPSLGFLPSTSEIEGLVDTHSGNALVNDCDNLYIWPFNSTQKQPSFTRVPLHEERVSLTCTPSVVFTWPAAIDDESTTKSAGVCIVNKKSGLVQFYEDIDTITNLSVLISKDKVYELNLKLKDKEIITNVVNCEPAGIVISTSNGRLLFVTIRDFMGKPSLNLRSQLVKSQVGFFRSSNKFKEFVSLEIGAILGKGERILSAITRGGEFQVWNLSAVANSYKRIEINLHDQILDSLQDLYPFANGSLEVLDSHPLPEGQAYLILSSIVDHEGSYYYILSTIKLDEKTNSFFIFSTYRLNTYTSAFRNPKYPKLLIPSSLSTETHKENHNCVISVHVVFEDAVVITQMSSKLDQTYPLRRKWEDIISFRSDVHLIGHGYDSKSIYLINKEMGVLKITANADTQNGDLQEVRFIKSHIDQAIYFSNLSSSLIEFNLPGNISLEREEIETDLMASSKEILLSRSDYIPPKLNSLENHVRLRVDLYKNLLGFTKSNFLFKISPQIKLDLIESFETLNCAAYLLSHIENKIELNSKWESVMNQNGITDEALFHHELDRFPRIFSQFLDQLNEELLTTSDLHSQILCIDLVIACIYNATLEQGEQFYRFEEFEMATSELNIELPWFAQNNFPKIINQMLFLLKHSADESNHLSDNAERFLVLVKILYYIFNQAFLWYQDESSRLATAEYKQLRQLFDSDSLQWNRLLCQVNCQAESLKICEYYEDLGSLVETLDTVNEDITAEVYDKYFEKFGYGFAFKLFSYYISVNRLQDLYFKFPNQHNYLVKFFNENPQYGNVEWIGEILEERYSQASEVLGKITCDKDNIDAPLDARQFRLSVAKLCGLVDDKNLNVDKLSIIQANLDAIDGQKDILNKLNSGIGLHNRFESSQVITHLFKTLSDNIRSQKNLPLSSITEIYTLLDSKDSFYCALKLLSLNTRVLEYEVAKFLNFMVWRRCILFDDWQAVKDETETALFYTLKKFFEETLYNSGCQLPDWSKLLDGSIVTVEYFKAEFSHFVEDPSELVTSAFDEIQSVKCLGEDFSLRIKSIIGVANELTGNKCVVNYETNNIEKMS